jgi:hypothetical protein
MNQPKSRRTTPGNSNSFEDMDPAIDSDRRYFEHFVTRNHRVREATASEKSLACSRGDTAIKGFRLYIAVRSMTPGVRSRTGFWAADLPQHLTEEEAAKICAHISRRSGAVPKHFQSVFEK